MVELTHRQLSFVKIMSKSDEHARRGFELLISQSKPELFFDALMSNGLFSASHNSPVVPATEVGYFRVPFWSSLKYLVAVARRSRQLNDSILRTKLMDVVRDVSAARDEHGRPIDNYHTYHAFAEILGLVPTDTVTLADIDLVQQWLSSRFDRTLTASELGQKVIPRFLNEDNPKNIEKACRLLKYCTAVQWSDENVTEGAYKKPTTLVEDYWLKDLIDKNASTFGSKAPHKSADIFIGRLREVFDGTRGVGSSLWRPAIEDHPQNHDWNGPENRFVEGLRNVLIVWVKPAETEAVNFLKVLLQDEAEIIRRIGLFILGHNLPELMDLYRTISNIELFQAGHHHELFNLLRQNFSTFPSEDKEATLSILEKIPLRGASEDISEEDRIFSLKHRQRGWLLAIGGLGYEPADEWLRKLNSELELESPPDHPDFLSYLETGWGTGPTPYQAQELLAFAEAGNLVETLNSFEQKDIWRGPSVESLIDALGQAVESNPKIFADILASFLRAKRPYQYGIIIGFKKTWEKALEPDLREVWEEMWPKLMTFFEKILNDSTLWIESKNEDASFYQYASWTQTAIADFLQAGTKNDEKAFAPELLPDAWRLLTYLLQNIDPADSADIKNPMSQALNTQKGRVLDALFNYALRACRLSNKKIGSHSQVWAEIEPTFKKELDKCQNANFEFSTFCGCYIGNLEFLSKPWLEKNFDRIFPVPFVDNFRCALDGLAYGSASGNIYSLLKTHSVIENAFRAESAGKISREKLIERMCLAYLWGLDDLQSERFELLFQTSGADDLSDATQFFWGVRGEKLTVEQIQKVIQFWLHCVSWSSESKSGSDHLLSKLSLLICYVDFISPLEQQLLFAVAPFVHINYNADNFIKELYRLAETSPDQVNAVLGRVLETYRPSYDFEDKLKNLLVKLIEKGKRLDVIAYAERLRDLPGMPEFYAGLMKANRQAQ